MDEGGRIQKESKPEDDEESRRVLSSSILFRVGSLLSNHLTRIWVSQGCLHGGAVRPNVGARGAVLTCAAYLPVEIVQECKLQAMRMSSNIDVQ